MEREIVLLPMEQKEAMAISMERSHRKLFFEPLGGKTFGLGEEAKKKVERNKALKEKKLFFGTDKQRKLKLVKGLVF